MFLKYPKIIIIKFDENVLCLKYRDMYEFRRVRRRHTHSTIHFLFIKKNGKSIRAWPILKLNSTSFWFKQKICRMNNNFRKRGPEGAWLLFLWSEMIVLIDFIAILRTPGIFLIQIVNTNNTNVYLIHFVNIKMCFPKSLILKLQTNLNHSLFITTRWHKLCWHQQRLSNNASPPDFQKKKKKSINNYYIYS